MNIQVQIEKAVLSDTPTLPGAELAPATAPEFTAPDLKERAGIVAGVAATHATAVDREGRFPAETLAALRTERLLGIMVPRDLGGDGATISDVVDVCYMLGRSCASSAMIYAMHQTKVALLVRHGQQSAWHQRLLRRLAAEQLLLASSTTEGQAGGDVRKSAAPIVQQGSRISLERDATVISYGAQADGVVTTARRSPEAGATDQVLVAFLKADYALERILEWDALGMRGTCSAGFKLKAGGEASQVLPEPYERIHVRTMVPVAHLTWSGAWTGVAAGAVERARLFVRNAAKRADGALPPGAAHLTRANANLRTLRAVVAGALQRFEATI